MHHPVISALLFSIGCSLHVLIWLGQLDPAVVAADMGLHPLWTDLVLVATADVLIKPELIRLCDLCSQQKKDGVTVFT